MLGKKVKVFWPVDESWYVGVVMSFDPSSGEHQLEYPDGDHEWVKIGDIISAAAGGGSSANNVPTDSSSLGGGVITGSHDPIPSIGAIGSGHETLGAARHMPPRQGPPPLQHPGQSPLRNAPLPQHQHPPQHRPDHRLRPSEDDNPSVDYPATGIGHPPSYYGGPYPVSGVGPHFSQQPVPGPQGVPQSYSGGGPMTGPPKQHGAAPQTHHHPNMPPPHHMLPYGMYPPQPGPPPGAYGGGAMFPSHPHMGGPPPYGMSPGAMGGVPPYYQSVGGANSPPPVRGDDDDDNSTGGGNNESGSRSRKTGPKPWTKEEDTLLLNLVHTMQWPMKWTIVAQSLPDRTGKQCRERYVNHLNPRLKASDWNPVEDSTIFHLYNTIGSHWAKMSKIIPGRTDNGIKNRFHNIRRQYEREDSHRLRLSSVEDFPDEIRLDRLRKFPEHLEGKSTQLWDMKGAIGVLAAQSVLGGNSSNNNNNLNRTGASGVSITRFGPFRKPKIGEIELCIRCGLIVPSIHTGGEICSKTGWCQSCTRIPPNVSGNLLRECLNLRRADNAEIRKIIESFEEFFVPDEENAWPYKKSNVRSVDKKDEDNRGERDGMDASSDEL
jgi:Myb-like DNA-binding domain